MQKCFRGSHGLLPSGHFNWEVFCFGFINIFFCNFTFTKRTIYSFSDKSGKSILRQPNDIAVSINPIAFLAIRPPNITRTIIFPHTSHFWNLSINVRSIHDLSKYFLAMLSISSSRRLLQIRQSIFERQDKITFFISLSVFLVSSPQHPQINKLACFCFTNLLIVFYLSYQDVCFFFSHLVSRFLI